MNSRGREQSIQGVVVVSSGAGSLTLTNTWEIVRWIRIKPIAESDTFTITISDADAIPMMVRTEQLGTFSERLEMSLGIMRTIAISGASQDGTFQVRLDMH